MIMQIVSKHITGHWAANIDTDEEMSWLPIVHVPHGPSHAGQPQPGGPGVILVTALAGARAHHEEESEDNVESDECEHHACHRAQVDPGDSAGHRALEPGEQGGCAQKINDKSADRN